MAVLVLVVVAIAARRTTTAHEAFHAYRGGADTEGWCAGRRVRARGP